MANETQPNVIIEKAKDFFRNEIAKNHARNTAKLVRLKEFNLNPFLASYKAHFLTGNGNPESVAKALVYARALGSSIDTTFGNQMQKFCSTVLEGFASTTSGIDIEYIDQLDGRKKYCQIKSGPNTINKDDIETIIGHFKGIKNLARTNHLDIGLNDLVVGVFYGTPEELNSSYKKINEQYPVIVGAEFWHRLTGEEDFYEKLIKGIGEVAKEYDGTELINNAIKALTPQIREAMDMEY